MEHSQAFELLEEYALANLEGQELEALEEHLGSGCQECLAKLRELSELTVLLARTLPQNQPSLKVKEQLIKNLSSARPVLQFKGQTRRLGWVATISIAAVLLLLLWNWDTRRKLTEVKQELERYQTQVVQLQHELAAYQDATLLLGQPGMQFVDLNGVEPNRQAFGKVVIDPKRGTGVVYMYRLPKTPQGKAYQLWVVREGKPTSVGLFTVAEDGSAVLNLKTLPDPSTIASFEVTIEPEGGASQPTGMMYLTGPATAPSN